MATDTAMKSNMDSNFENQITQQQLNAERDGAGPANADWEEAQWNMPQKGEWSGDLFNTIELGVPFKRDEANNAFSEAISNPNSPGRVGDCVIGTVQADYLGCMERAFRARHTMRRPRAFLHAMSRRKGHGSQQGTFTQCGLEYVRALLRQTAGN